MISATEVKVMDLSIEGESLGLFQVTSEWEGFKKLTNLRNGLCVILMPTVPDGMANCFEGLFAGISGTPIVKDMQLIAASPGIMTHIQQIKKKATAND